MILGKMVRPAIGDIQEFFVALYTLDLIKNVWG
jgi:hypothetical protein